MQAVTAVTQKGQITIPQEIREQFGIRAYGKVRLEARKGYIAVFPEEDILDLAGTFVPRRKRSVLAARKAFEASYKRF